MDSTRNPFETISPAGLRKAGKDEGVEYCLRHENRPPTPPHVKQYRTILEPGVRVGHPGTRHERSVLARGAEDIVHGTMTCGTTLRDFTHAEAKSKTAGSGGTVEVMRRGGPIVTAKSIVQPEVDINASLVARKAEENYYKSTKREPLGKGYTGEITLPDKVKHEDYRFGGKEKVHVDIKEILNPPSDPNAEMEQRKETIYQKSHRSYPPGVQYRGGVDWNLTNVDPEEHTFGLPSSYEGTATSNIQQKSQRTGQALTEEKGREKLFSKKATLLFNPSSVADCIQPEVSDPPVEVMRGGNILGNTVTNSDFATKRREVITAGKYDVLHKITKPDNGHGILNGKVDVQFIRAPALTRIVPKVQLDTKGRRDPPLGRSVASGLNLAATVRKEDTYDMEDTLQCTAKLGLPKGVYESDQRKKMAETTEAYQDKKRIERSDLSMTVAGALTGNYESQELRPDRDLGSTSTLGFRNAGMAHPNYRFGQITIRNTTDSTSFSRTGKPPSLLATDVATVREVIHSSGNSETQIDANDFKALRTAPDIRQLFEKIGVHFSDVEFDLMWQRSIMLHTNEYGTPGTMTSVGAFRKIVNEVQSAMDEDQLPQWLIKGLQEHGALP